MEALSPVHTSDLFLPLHDELLRLLRGLNPEQWARQTVAKQWAVRDVVAHLLDCDLRVLSLRRDGAQIRPDKPIDSFESLLGFLNGLNADWTRAAQRLSPRVMTDLLGSTGPQVAEYYSSLDPNAPAPFSVAWAGEAVSENWFDVGRDYTERWHHQQQIRDAVGAPLQADARWLRPVIDISIRALPFAYRDLGKSGDAFTVEIVGKAGGMWTMRRDDCWKIYSGADRDAASKLTVPEDLAWRLFFKWPVENAIRNIQVEGNAVWGERYVRALAVMA